MSASARKTDPRVTVHGYEDQTHGSVFDLRLITHDDEQIIARNLTPTALASLIVEASRSLTGHLMDQEEGALDPA